MGIVRRVITSLDLVVTVLWLPFLGRALYGLGVVDTWGWPWYGFPNADRLVHVSIIYWVIAFVLFVVPQEKAFNVLRFARWPLHDITFHKISEAVGVLYRRSASPFRLYRVLSRLVLGQEWLGDLVLVISLFQVMHVVLTAIFLPEIVVFMFSQGWWGVAFSILIPWFLFRWFLGYLSFELFRLGVMWYGRRYARWNKLSFALMFIALVYIVLSFYSLA